jgi:hypothetical protein
MKALAKRLGIDWLIVCGFFGYCIVGFAAFQAVSRMDVQVAESTRWNVVVAEECAKDDHETQSVLAFHQ